MERLIYFERPNVAVLEESEDIRTLWDGISQLRHTVFSDELSQYEQQESGRLEDPGQHFICLTLNDNLIGYISINSPSEKDFRMSKYFTKDAMENLATNFQPDGAVYEIRGLTLAKQFRGQGLGLKLMLASLKFAENDGATDLIAMGHTEALPLYNSIGMEVLMNHSSEAGAVKFYPMHLSIDSAMERATNLLDQIDLETLELNDDACYHGGASWEASGLDFEVRGELIVADVLDSPFPPHPKAVDAITKNMQQCFKESPPTQCEPLVEKIAETRSINQQNILVSSGSSSLMFSLFPQLIDERSKVLILSPMYGEYLHILTHLIGCNVTHFPLYPDEGFEIDKEGLISVSREHDAVIFVNPNSPTGVYCEDMEYIVRAILSNEETETSCKTVWVDETYIEYLSNNQSLEFLSEELPELIICKSMSKCYALSGLRVAYAVTSRAHSLRKFIPPWAVSLPAQIAAIESLSYPEYFQEQYDKIHISRENLSNELRGLGFKVYPGVANYILTELPENYAHNSTGFVSQCREKGIFLRDAENMGITLNSRFVRFAIRSKAENDKIIDCLIDLLDNQ